MLRLGFQSCRYNNLLIEQELDMAFKSKIDFFDVFFDGFTPDEVLPASDVKLAPVVTVHLPLDFTSLRSEDKEKYFEYINNRKPQSVTVHFDNLSYEELELICSKVGRPVVCIENTIPDRHRIYGSTYREFVTEAKKILERKLLKFNLTLDTGHAKINGFNPARYAKELIADGNTILTVHLHDNDGVHDSHSPAGSVAGGIDFEEFLNVVRAQEKDVWGVIEHWNNNYNALEYLSRI